MPKFNFEFKTIKSDSFRVAALTGAYDLSDKNYIQKFEGEIPIEGKEWSVGLIVGSSGSGKSSIARQCFGEFFKKDYKEKSLLDDFDKSLKTEDVFQALSSVGFNSPPCWLKPYSVLSEGQKMRVDLAQAILSSSEPIVFDEFTSVVDRQVAQVGSFAIQKSIRSLKKKFIAVSCHRDVMDWLSPDWVYDTDLKQFFFIKTELQDLPLKSKLGNVSDQYGVVLKSFTI